jgi:signal-transduction protein with cAMP-binding, CBS, and nucleotidyltransferase domain
MSIASLCSKKPVLLDRGAGVKSACSLMSDENVGSVIVMEGGKRSKVVGIVTDRDIALHAFRAGMTARTPVEKIMSKKVLVVNEETGIFEAIDQMEKHGVRRLVVQTDDGEICGVVSTDDILNLLSREMSSIGKLLDKQARAGGKRSMLRAA